MKLLLISLKDNSNWMCAASTCLPVMCYYRFPSKLQEGNVFSHVCLSVCQFMGGARDHYLSCIEPHFTGTPSSGPSLLPDTGLHCTFTPPLTKSPLDMEPHCTRTPLPNQCPTGVNIWRMRSGSGRYASHWNAFLL